LLWEEYREAAQGVAYSRSRFYERYLAFVGTLKRSMRQTHVAGEKLFESPRTALPRAVNITGFAVQLRRNTQIRLASRRRVWLWVPS
jgi:hypothetical protein